MKNRIILAIIFFLFLGVTAKRGGTTDIPRYNLPDLVIKSDIIASGTVTIRDVETILVTDQVLKGQAPKKLNIIDNFGIQGVIVKYTENENVLLFMQSIDADSACLTSSYLSKWPRPNSMREYGNILDNTSPQGIADLVKEILSIEAKTDINDRLNILKSWLDSSDSLLNLIALQYVLSSHIWPKGLSPDYQTGFNITTIRKQLSGYAFKLIQSGSPSIQVESIRLLQYADPERALPILISKITDPNRNIREATCSELMSFSHGKDMDDNLIYRFNESPEELLSVQRKWQEWYDDANFDK
jgi:hypothetical protein